MSDETPAPRREPGCRRRGRPGRPPPAGLLLPHGSNRRAAEPRAHRKPEGYDEATYEILFRAIEAGQKGGISNKPVGWNYGKDWNWTTLNHDERIALAKKHEHWQRGLLRTLQNHPRVPEEIRGFYAKWGLPGDEFTDNGHWPHQLYIREARRMVSDFVMTQHHCMRKEPVPESIGLAADLCLKDNLAVQSLPYEKLRPVLLEAGQALDVTK